MDTDKWLPPKWLKNEKKLFNKVYNSDWNKFSIADEEARWTNSLTDDEYYASGSLRGIRQTLENFCLRGLWEFKPNYEELPEDEPKVDFFPFIGKKYGHLLVTSVYFPKKLFQNKDGNSLPPSGIRSKLRCNVKCDCGNESDYNVNSLTSGTTTHCGCKKPVIPPTTLDIVDGKLVTDANLNIDNNGYVSCSIRNGEYNGQTFHGPYSEHSLVYQMYHGIKLKKNQNIHHKNGVRNDNHIDNLELWDTSQPAGQRVIDKLSYYFDYVKSHIDNPKYRGIITSELSQLNKNIC